MFPSIICIVCLAAFVPPSHSSNHSTAHTVLWNLLGSAQHELHCLVDLEMNWVWGVMIQSEHCSLHCCNPISTVLRSDEGVWRRAQNFNVLAAICADLLFSASRSILMFDPTRFTHDWVRKTAVLQLHWDCKLSFWTPFCVLHGSASTDL